MPAGVPEITPLAKVIPEGVLSQEMARVQFALSTVMSLIALPWQTVRLPVSPVLWKVSTTVSFTVMVMFLLLSVLEQPLFDEAVTV